MRLRIPGTAFLLIGSFILAGSAACGGSPSTPSPTDPSQNLNVPYSQIDLVVGTGRQAANGNNVTVNYTGWLYNPSAADNKGAQFDTSALRCPFAFKLGQRPAMPGWDAGVIGRAVGSKRRSSVPPSLGYASPAQ